MKQSADKNEILRYLDEHGIVNKDLQKADKPRARKKNIQGKSKNQRIIVDLHKKTKVEATLLMRKGFRECQRKSIKNMLIVHGKGFNSDPFQGPVLKKLVYSLLTSEFRSEVADFRTALPKDGGEGATYVRLS